MKSNPWIGKTFQVILDRLVFQSMSCRCPYEVLQQGKYTNQDTWVYTGLHFHLQPPALHHPQSLKNVPKRDDSAWSLFGAGYLQVAAADVLKL